MLFYFIRLKGELKNRIHGVKVALLLSLLPQAVCCADGDHCCPTNYKCNENMTSCIKGEVVIPWYTKLPATTSLEADPSSVQCDGLEQCPEHTTCCQLSTGEWGCCPLQNVSAMCVCVWGGGLL